MQAVWASGIAVVDLRGQRRAFNGTISSPGDDPLVITVGALDDMAASSIAGDEMCDFSVRADSADGLVKPEPGHFRPFRGQPGRAGLDDLQRPSARIGSANFVGSGTSFSAAITSGAAALVLAESPGLTPNQLKARLLGTLTRGRSATPSSTATGRSTPMPPRPRAR